MPSLTFWSDIFPLNLNELEGLSLVKSAIALLLTKAGASQVVYDLKVSRFWGSTNHTRKRDQIFMDSFLCQNTQIFLSHILLTIRINKFWFKGVKKNFSGSIRTF